MSTTSITTRAPPTPPLSDEESSFRRVEVKSEDALYERKMGDSELSYYLPSRENGVNDMYLHLGLRAPYDLMEFGRVSIVWAILRLRHPLLSSRVVMHDYDDVRFVYSAPKSPSDVMRDAAQNLEYRVQSKHDLIDTYLNGQRTLSNYRLSYLVIASSRNASQELLTPLSTPRELSSPTSFDCIPAENEDVHIRDYDIMICAAHFLGDGMALHNFANDFFGLLGSNRSLAELADVLRLEWTARWSSEASKEHVLPSTLEDRLPPIHGNFRLTAARVDYQNSQDKLIGGHVFPRRKADTRRTVVPTVSFNEKQTKQVLQKCKSKGVSISNAVFSLCNIAWIRATQNRPKTPVMMYSALNLRPYLNPLPSDSSYWFLAVGYFNVILPNFLLHGSSDEKSAFKAEQTFWHRARVAKVQGNAATRHPLLVSRAHLMAQERGQRARNWAKEDDEKANGTWNSSSAPVSTKPALDFKRDATPSSALIGLSLLGNLDGIYKHASFGDIKINTLTTGSRQRSGAMLLFNYTFAGKLWLSLGYDENGLDRDIVDKFWIELLNGVDEFLLH